MILAIDIGNTNVVLGGIEGSDILFEARMATDSIKTSDQYCAELKNILALFDVVPSMIDGTIVASVVPPVLNSFRTAIRKLTGKSCLVVGPGIRTGLNIRMDNPTEIGSDLIVASVAAIHDYGAPLLIVDMGTATTITAIDKDGVYSGGCICPGLKISLEALTGRTAQLPGISLGEPQRAIGKIRATPCAAASCSVRQPCSTACSTAWSRSLGPRQRSWRRAASPNSLCRCAAESSSTTAP